MKMMSRLTTLAAPCVAITCAATGQLSGPVQTGDIAFGLSNGDATVTAELVRGCVMADSWQQLAWLQSMEFDNVGGPNSHGGVGANLLALNFGTSGGGGTLASLAANGTDAGEQIFAFDGTSFGIGMTRVGGLSVSPDNSRVACIGYAAGSLIVLDYQAGNGDGTGAAILDGSEFTFVGVPAVTQGTAWLDNDTVLTYVMGLLANTAVLKAVDATTGAETEIAVVTIRGQASVFTDVDYNPNISPYAYCYYSSFDGGTFNTLAVIDPTDGTILKRILLDNSMNTGREIALGPDNLLYMGQFGSDIDTITADPTQMVDDGSIDCYAGGVFSSFNGLDVALADTVGGGFTLDLFGNCPNAVELGISGATPDGLVAVTWGTLGQFIIPSGFPCTGVTLDIRPLGPTAFQTFRANANGEVTRGPLSIPAALCGKAFQALDIDSCTVSNVATF